MNCANHPDVAATAFCRNCGKPLCSTCQRPAQGTILCEEDFAATAGAASSSPGPAPDPATAGGFAGTPPYSAPPPPYSAPPASGPNPYLGSVPSPGLAFILGFIPGVGAVYNGQYAKGLIHAIIFGLLVSIQSTGAAPGMEPLIGILTGVWIFYMAFEAYHTAGRRARGEFVDEFSSIVPMQRTGSAAAGTGFPVGPVVLIGLGVLFLLNTLELVRLRDILRFWPLFLIGIGAYMLWVRLSGREPEEFPAEGVRRDV